MAPMDTPSHTNQSAEQLHAILRATFQKHITNRLNRVSWEQKRAVRAIRVDPQQQKVSETASDAASGSTLLGEETDRQ